MLSPDRRVEDRERITSEKRKKNRGIYVQEVDYVNVRAHRVWLIVFTGQRVSGAFEILKKGDAFSEGSTFLGNHSLPCGLQKISAYCNAVPTVMRVCGMNPFSRTRGP